MKELVGSPEEQRAALLVHLQQGVEQAVKAWG